MSDKYRMVCYMRLEPEGDEAEVETLREAMWEASHASLMQPENKYIVEHYISGEWATHPVSEAAIAHRFRG